jgi:hypothetical protein
MKKILLLAVLAFVVIGGTTAFVIHHPGPAAACNDANC